MDDGSIHALSITDVGPRLARGAFAKVNAWQPIPS